MKKPAVLGVYGKSNSGKTTLMIELIKRLKYEGYRVASVKKTDKRIGLDETGKDTFRHADAGSETVVFSSSVETSYIVKKRQNTKDIIRNIMAINYYDVILIEGCNDDKIPKIRMGDIKKRENTVLTFNQDFEKVYNIIIEMIGEKTK